jgi:hypothetical protein
MIFALQHVDVAPIAAAFARHYKNCETELRKATDVPELR